MKVIDSKPTSHVWVAVPIVRVHHPGDAVVPVQLQVTFSGVVSFPGSGSRS